MQTASGHKKPPRFAFRRRRWLGVAGLLMLAAVPGFWLLSHTFDQSPRFTARRGPIVLAQPQAETVTAAGYITQPVRVTASTGLVVDFRVLRPARLVKPLPVVVLLGGHRTGRNAVDLIGDPGEIVLAALDYPYHGPERTRGVRETLGSIPAVQRGLLDTPPAISVALDWLLTQPWADADRVELMGVSLGVPFAAVAGALDNRFRRVWLIHGGVDNRAWLANRLEAKIPNRLLREPSAALLHLLAYGSSFQTERWTPSIAPRALVIVGARQDEQMSAENVSKLHAASSEPKDLLWTEGGHVGAQRPEIVRQLLAMVRQRIAEQDQPAEATD